MKTTCRIIVRGRLHTWSFPFVTDDQRYIKEWEADGLDVSEVVGTFPAWLPWWGVRPWAAMQDAWKLVRLW